MIYGPSASTGLTAGATTLAMTGSPLFAFLAGFTLLGAALALKRTVPILKRASDQDEE